VFALAWVVSGTISMNPWGFLEGRGGNERVRLAGEPLPWSAYRESLSTLNRNASLARAVSLANAPHAGKLFWLARWPDGKIQRLDADGGQVSVRRHAQTSEAAGIDEPQFPARRQFEDSVSVLQHFRMRLTDLQPARHAEMHDPLRLASCGAGALALLCRRNGRRTHRPDYPSRPLPVHSSAVRGRGRPRRIILILFQVEDDVLPHAAHGGDAAVFEGRCDFCCGRFQDLFFLAEPDGFHDVSRDPLGQATRNGFDFGEFGHVYTW